MPNYCVQKYLVGFANTLFVFFGNWKFQQPPFKLFGTNVKIIFKLIFWYTSNCNLWVCDMRIKIYSLINMYIVTQDIVGVSQILHIVAYWNIDYSFSTTKLLEI